MARPGIHLSFPEVFRTDEVIVYQPRENLFVLQTRKGVSVSIYVLVGPAKALVIDAGMTLTDLTSVIKRVTDKPFELAITHCHIDHIGAIREFDRIYLHPEDKEMISDYAGTIIDIRPGYKFDLGGLIIEVIELAGHTPGSIGFLDIANKRLFSGDAIGSSNCLMMLTRLPLECLLGTLRHLEAIKDRWTGIWVGHLNQCNKVFGMDSVLTLKQLV
jgi:glyoxylase-like metal-dependent hydrolase (beta-lactamase superfamily II)